MTDIEIFHLRVLNWSRVYKNRPVRLESNLAPLLRTLELLNKPKRPVKDEWGSREERLPPPDAKDADVLDSVYPKLRSEHKRILKVAYLTTRTSESFDCTEDMRRVDVARANFLHLWLRSYYKKLREAEAAFMYAVDSIEKKYNEND